MRKDARRVEAVLPKERRLDLERTRGTTPGEEGGEEEADE